MYVWEQVVSVEPNERSPMSVISSLFDAADDIKTHASFPAHTGHCTENTQLKIHEENCTVTYLLRANIHPKPKEGT